MTSGLLDDLNSSDAETRLAAFEAIVHELMLGRNVEAIANDGQSVTYSRANLPQLQSETQRLRVATGKAGRRHATVITLR